MSITLARQIHDNMLLTQRMKRPFGCCLSVLTSLAVIASLCLGGRANAEEESRIWTDKTGKHQIRAKFVDVKDGKVRLERPNGTISSLSLDKLSEADQKVIQSFKNKKSTDKPSKKKQPQTKKPNVLSIGDQVEANFAGNWITAKIVSIDYKRQRVEVQLKGKSAAFTPGMSLDEIRFLDSFDEPIIEAPQEKAGSSLPEVSFTNMSAVERLLLGGTSEDRASADPAIPEKSEWKPRAIRLHDRTNFFDSSLDFSLATSGRPMAIVLQSHGMPSEDEYASIELIDLKTKKPIKSGPAPPNTTAVRLSPSGSAIATMVQDDFSSKDPGQLDFWKVSENQISHWISFQPYRSGNVFDHKIVWFEWLDDTHLLTTNSKGRIILWGIDGAKAIYELPTGSNCIPTLSPGRKQLAIPSDVGIQICNSRTGELLAVVGSGNFSRAKLAFSPSAKKIAAASGDFIDVVDITTGMTTLSFPCKGAGGFSNHWWIDEQFLFIDKQYLVDVERRMVAWKYEIASELVRRFGDTQWVYLENRLSGLRTITPFELPPQEAIDAMAKLDQDAMLSVRPGASVSIDVQIPEEPLLAKEVLAALKNALLDAGMKVADDQPLRLVAKLTHGKTEKVTYQTFGAFNREQETFPVTDRVYELELYKDGVVIWSRTATHSAPHHIQLEKGESFRQGVARVMSPKKGHFQGRLPAYVLKPEFQKPIGSSKLSLN